MKYRGTLGIFVLVDLVFLAISAWGLSGSLADGDTGWSILNVALVILWSYWLVRDMEAMKNENEQDPH
jgi:hypothetical protein